ncbi:MAG: hypothetical protein ABFC89_10705 [Methanospirillum sp.]
MTPARTAHLLILLLLLLLGAAAPVAAGTGDTWVFAYQPGCTDCIKALPFIEAYRAAHPEQPIELLDVTAGEDAALRYAALSKKYGVRPLVPALFAGGWVAVGFDEIRTFLSGASPVLGSLEENATPLAPLAPLTPFAVAVAGLVDGINPCAFAVLTLLLGTLAATGSRGRALLLGGAYTAGIFVCYIAAGLGIVGAVGALGLASTFRLAAGIISLVLGPAILFSALGFGEAFRPVLPTVSRVAIGKWIRSARTAGPIAALALGFGVGLIELPCTGGIYLGVLGVLAGGAVADAVPLLVLYNLCFVLPLALIVGAVAFGLGPASVDRWRQERRRLVMGATGLVMVVLGAAVLAEFFV